MKNKDSVEFEGREEGRKDSHAQLQLRTIRKNPLR